VLAQVAGAQRRVAAGELALGPVDV
jgi:hypothetical protein